MDTKRDDMKDIEDLPVDAEQAAEVIGGQDFHFKSVIDPTNRAAIDPNVTSFSWGMK